jgi:hypothetical protein
MPMGAFLGMSVAPSLLTMFLAGVWHGAGLQFMVFGLLHALFLSINHTWRTYGPRAPAQPRPVAARWTIAVAQVALTHLCVLVTFVFFRANSVEDATALLAGMAGLHGLEAKYMSPAAFAHLGALGRQLVRVGLVTQTVPDVRPELQPAQVLLRYLIIFVAPNTQQIMAAFQPYLAKVEPPRLRIALWRPTLGWAAVIGVLFLLDLLALNYSPPFLYFQF